jgi:hypothetical protein
MTSAAVSLNTDFAGANSGENIPSATRAYLTNTSFVAVHFNEAGKGRIMFLEKGSMLRIVGPSSCLREGFEVTFERRIHHVFEIDLMTRCTLIFETVKGKRRAMAALRLPQ